MSDGVEKAIRAGGCFWGMEDLFRKRPGVISTRVGYTGGDVPNATYGKHDGHAEAIEIVSNPEQIGAALDISPQQVRALKRTALQRLRELSSLAELEQAA